MLGTGYATYAFRFNPASYAAGDTDNETLAKVQDLGTISLVKSVSVTVNVVDALTSAPVTGATIYAAIGVGGSSVSDNDVGTGGLAGTTGDNFYGALEIACTAGNTTANLPEVLADSDSAADGTCILSGLNPLVDYDFVVTPLDTNEIGRASCRERV